MKKSLTSLLVLAMLSACAAAPETIAPTYVSPAVYAGQSCSQLNTQAAALSGRLSAATGQQAKAASDDAGKTALTLILFWPAVFWIGNKDQGPQIAQMRGEAEALRAAAAVAGCT